jgi:ABC-2 type transport system ATP-binding protein
VKQILALDSRWLGYVPRGTLRAHPIQGAPALSTEQPALRAVSLAKRFRRRTWALQGIDLDIPSGSITALVGPNAAGKSTLLKTWLGFERPTSGTVEVAGIDPFHRRAAALAHVGHVPQSPTLYDALTADEHLELAAQLRPGFDRAYARERLERLSIPGDQLGRTLSGGQQAQVALAIALGTRADILLLDEPLASLDPLARREFLHVLTDAVRERQTTAVLSSHIVTDVEQACDRIVVLGVGRVLLHDAVAHALADHEVMSGPIPPTDAIGSFASPRGQPMTLARRAADAARSPGRPATLEEIVLGYLAAGRTPNVAAA